MIVFDKSDIVVVPFPFVDANLAKPRPALVVTLSKFNVDNQHTVLAMITTATHTIWPSDVKISELSSTGLDFESIVRMKIFTLDNRLIVKKIGCLGKVDTNKVFMQIKRSMLEV